MDIKQYIKLKGLPYDLRIPRVMGIINTTPDSFYSSSRVETEEEVLKVVKRMVEEGADILDVGGYSSRPGAGDIDTAAEIERVTMVLKVIRDAYPDIIVSLDTFRADVAQFGIEQFSVDIINDISGGELDSEMFPLIAREDVPYILMHMRGTPGTMQQNPEYDYVVKDILEWLNVRIANLVALGVNDIIVDPGFGFGKTADHNFEVLRKLGMLRLAGLPVLAGLSRKSIIWKELGITAESSLTGTIALNMIALINGASILRVHDVKEAVETVTLYRRTFQRD